MRMAQCEGGAGSWQAALARRLTAVFREAFGSEPRELQFVLAPYRLCPLGAHVDHQLGLATGMALDRGVLLAFAPNEAKRVRVRSLDFPGLVEFPLDAVPAGTAGDWGNYVRGATMALTEHYELLTGMDAVIGGSVPIGGLSSSAAVGCAYLLALEKVNALDVDAFANISLDQRIENGYLGLQNGILDQSMILLAKRSHLAFLDCQARTVESIPPAASLPNVDLLIVHSGVTQALTGTDYNQRVAQCGEAAKRLLQLAGEPAPQRARLRGVPREVYLRHRDKLPLELRKRAVHFFSECERVTAGVAAWRRGDLEAFGHLVRDSGRSSLENYECGSPELTSLYTILCQCEGVLGARFSGAGFRGSCIGFSDPSRREQIRETLAAQYRAAHPNAATRMEVHFCASAGGARFVHLVG
ncbi:MAG: hypothetical protein COZ06_16690 [Armatimonadetes bacterium CG_4_10_14_3_um_filter_66_18]|nr:MAG: hypothetical protein COS65_31365 [Armatimonadetes bacterium CG06_land_8_20_14_3_00_66_21]PIX50190.1 MAG: hypothetical protein COZ57_00110 [Armatimonadetes bacterium CG_4_8_14_3_um_filter_66_20]PIY48323.1 MAG: hypothetical protein COZ06_16690 [Armatimonadetes bacterium CG_4_10_14_3_um_filter_66_18]PIZ43676.1 MAG: hypothetical protein COY42_15400 [Armatimonadetes bacterium CG_4_10_14_0_8_um_filter_66_14]PJB63897.1 MAG: hypothetical protein CO096_20705 [Armatimonadetes bacterium CG_4_9_14_